MKAKEWRAKTAEELREEIGNISKELFNLRLQKSRDQLENRCLIRSLRKDLARIKTILRESEMAKEVS